MRVSPTTLSEDAPPVNPREAARNMVLAANAGVCDAQLWLAHWHPYGIAALLPNEIPPTTDADRYWYSQAAAQGNATAARYQAQNYRPSSGLFTAAIVQFPSGGLESIQDHIIDMCRAMMLEELRNEFIKQLAAESI